MSRRTCLVAALDTPLDSVRNGQGCGDVLTDEKRGFCCLVIAKRDRQASKTTDMASCALTCKSLTADCVDNADISLDWTLVWAP
jgi:hypothetical protein